MQHIGILAHSADGATLCFLEMVRESARRLGEHDHPEITLSILPMAPMLEAYDRNELGALRAHLAQTVSRLANAGCDFFVCPDNTATSPSKNMVRRFRCPVFTSRTSLRSARKRRGAAAWACSGHAGRWQVPSIRGHSRAPAWT